MELPGGQLYDESGQHSPVRLQLPLNALLEQGEDLAAVSRILGHASITSTANVYGHLTDAMLGKAADRTDTIPGRQRAVADA